MGKCLSCGKEISTDLGLSGLCPLCYMAYEQPSSRKYFECTQKMMNYRIKDMLRFDASSGFFEAGESALSLLPKAINEWKIHDKLDHVGFEVPPVIPCRDQLADMYMRFGKWEDARRVIRQCHKIGISLEREFSESLKWISDCDSTAHEALSFIKYNPGILQRTLRSTLAYLKKEPLDWFMRNSRQIRKVKSGSTNELYLNE